MKKIIAALLIASMLSACGNPMTVHGKTYPTYGIVNEDTDKSDKMCYKVSVGNVIWSIILVETFVFPIYFVGWSLWEPVSEKGANGGCGIDSK